MNKQESITQKVNELREAVRASKGSVMVIGIAPTENENESVIIASLQGERPRSGGSCRQSYGKQDWRGTAYRNPRGRNVILHYGGFRRKSRQRGSSRKRV